jgi:2-octaprenyl-6-methoxyphenol hydroxylase
MNNTNYDVLIIGGSLVGASAALALSALGLSVLVIEERSAAVRSDPGFDGRAIVLAPASQRFFANLNVWEYLGPSVTPIQHIHVSERGKFGATRLNAEQPAQDALGYVIEAHQLQQILSARCLQTDNLRYLSPAQYQNLKITAEGCSAQIIFEGETHEIQAKLLIAADGVNSAVRQQVAVGQTVWDYQQTALVTNLGLAREHAGHAYERFTDQGSMGFIPMSGSRVGLVWAVPNAHKERVLALSDAELLGDAQAALGYRLGRFLRVGQRQLYPLSLTRAEQTVGPGWVLLGNAAQSLHPIAGQGFNLGLRDVAQLQATLAARGEKALGDLGVLAEYAKARTADQTRIIRFSDGLNRVFTNPLRSVGWLRHASLLAMEHIPPLKQRLMQTTMGLRGPLPPLLCDVYG